MYSITTATKKIHGLSKRIRAVQGGTSAGKTIGICQELIHLAQTDKKPTLTSITSESFPHLRRGVMKDFLDILETQQYFKPDKWSKTDFTYTFETGSKIEFFSLDQPHKVRGPRRDRLFINEANNNHFESFEQLEVRTKGIIWLDWNPTNEFWYYEHVDSRDDVEHIILTYLDNEALDENIIKSIEQRKGRPDWWRVYGQGLLGEVHGKIYRNWEVVDEIPKEARLERRWLDFGYTNDPSACGDLYYLDGSYYVDERFYLKGLSNKQLAETMLTYPKTLTIADSAEPKSIDEIRTFGLNVVGSKKGKDSVMHNIQSVQEQQIFVTKRSINIIKENRNYLFMVDKDGKILNQEDPMCANHHMAGIRYAVSSLVPVMRKREFAWNQPNYANQSKKPNRAR